MGKAPSEKHLEDWIVTNPKLFGEQQFEPDEYWDGYMGYIERIVARQFPLPSGICDLVALTNNLDFKSLAVVEIKKGEVDAIAVTQCLRYMRDFKEIFGHVRGNWGFHAGRTYSSVGIFEEAHLGHTSEIVGYVVGHSLNDANLCATCQACSIVPVIYDYCPETDSYEFEFIESDLKTRSHERREAYYRLSLGHIAKAMTEVIEHRVNQHNSWIASNE